jgi:hypothetical protein
VGGVGRGAEGGDGAGVDSEVEVALDLIVVEFEALVVVCVDGFAQGYICKERHELAELVVLEHISDLCLVTVALAIADKVFVHISVFDDFCKPKYHK